MFYVDIFFVDAKEELPTTIQISSPSDVSETPNYLRVVGKYVNYEEGDIDDNKVIFSWAHGEIYSFFIREDLDA